MRTSLRNDNRGAALVTVLIAVTFMAFLVTTLLYVSSTNYKTKQLDYMNKVSFYQTEAPLEEIRARLMMEASYACEKAYKEVMLRYATLNATERNVLYYKLFAIEMQNQWNAYKAGATLTDFEVLRDCFMAGSANSTYLMEDASVPCEFYKDEVNGLIELRNVHSGMTVNNYTTYIQTTICVKAPDFNWNMETSGAYTSGDIVEREYVEVDECVVFKDWSKY